MSEDTSDERRKFHRVQVESLGASLSGLDVILVGVGPVELFDISYGGAAFSQPGNVKLSMTGETIQLEFSINGQKAQDLSAKVVRLTNENFAVEFINATQETKIFVDKLISNRMVGLNMNLIDPQFYTAKGGFNYWFHGPKNTNLFIWEADGKLLKASLDLADVALHWENGQFQIDNKMNRAVQGKLHGAVLGEGVFRQAGEIITQMRSNVEALEEFKQYIMDKVLKK